MTDGHNVRISNILKGLIEFLEKNVSEYCTTTYSFKSELKNKDFTEVTAEVIAKNATNPDEFTAEFDRLLRGVVDGRTES